MIDQVRPQDLAAWLDHVRQFGSPVVLDVREPHELQMASIQADGFTLLTIPMGVIPPRLNELDPQQPIACLCHHGGRSMQVAMFLERKGYSAVYNLTGGVEAWAGEVDPSMRRY